MAIEIVIAKRAFIVLALLVILAVTGLWVLVYLPKATITISPATTSHSVDQMIILSGSAKEPDFARFILPTRVVTKEVEKTQVITRADATTSDSFAQGTITLQNDQLEKQSLLPKTHLKHEATGTYFLTDTPVTIPPQGKVAMHITAEQKGASGNVPPGKFIIDKLPATVQKAVFGTSDVALSGGTVVETPLTQTEIDSAVQTLLSGAHDEVLGALTAVSNGARIRPELLSTQTEAQDASAEVGSKTSNFSVHVKIKVTGFVVDENDLLSLTLLALRNAPQGDEEFVSYDPPSFTIHIEKANFDTGEAVVKGTLTGFFAHKIGLSAIQTDRLAGLSADEIKELLKKVPGIGSVTVTFSPFWVTSAPNRAQAITTKIEAGTKNGQ